MRVLGHEMKGEVESEELWGENVRGGLCEDVDGVLDCEKSRKRESEGVRREERTRSG